MVTLLITILGIVLIIVSRLNNAFFDDHISVWKKYYRPTTGTACNSKIIVDILGIAIIILGIALTFMI